MQEKIRNSNFTITPNELIDHAIDFNLSNRQFRLIVTVLRYQWEDNLPCSTNLTISKLLGVNERTIQRESTKLQKMGLLVRAKGGKKPFWDFSPLKKRAKELSTDEPETDSPDSPDKSEKDGKKEVANPDIDLSRLETSKTNTSNQKTRQNKPLTQTNLVPNPDNIELSTIKDLKTKDKNKPTQKVSLIDRVSKCSKINSGKKPNFDVNSFLKKQKRLKSKDTLRGKTLMQEVSQFYDNLPHENNLERLTEVLAEKVVDIILIMKEPQIRSRCKVSYYRINQQALIKLTLENFKFEDIPIGGSKKRRFLVLAVCKRAWRVIISCLEKESFPLATTENGGSENPIPENSYRGDAPQEEAKRILKSLINTGKEDTSFEVRKSAHSEISFRHNGHGAGTNGHRARDKAQEERNQDKGKPLKSSLGKSSLSKPNNGNGHRRVSDAKLHKAFHSLSWYRKYKERRSSIN